MDTKSSIATKYFPSGISAEPERKTSFDLLKDKEDSKNDPGDQISVDLFGAVPEEEKDLAQLSPKTPKRLLGKASSELNLSSPRETLKNKSSSNPNLLKVSLSSRNPDTDYTSRIDSGILSINEKRFFEKEPQPSKSETETARFLLERIPENRRPSHIEEVSARIRNGESVLLEILTDHPPESTLENIANLQWALFARAVNKNKGFLSGTIAIEDPQHKIFNFLNQNSQAYTRLLSSHYQKAQLKEFADKGLNFPGDFTKGPLPCGKRHIIFGALDNGATFIKWEDYSTKPSHFVPHMLGYFSKKDSFGHDTEDIHRENIQEDTQKYFDNFLSNHNIQLTKEQKADVEVHGISGMLRVAKEHHLRDELTSHPIFKDLDHLEMRKGNEVIFTKEDLLKRKDHVPQVWTLE